MDATELNFTLEADKGLKKCAKDGKGLATMNKTKKPCMLKRLQRNRYQPRSVYYFTEGRQINLDSVSEETSKRRSPYYYPKDVGDFSYRTQHREEHATLRKKAKLYEHYNRPSYKSRLNEGKLERLHVSTSGLELPGKSLTDNVDQEFFTIVSGSPIAEKFDIDSYLKDLRSLFLIRLQIGFRYDETYLMEEMHIEERRRLAEIRKNFEVIAECYDKFLAEDHASSLELLKAAEEEIRKSKMTRERIKQLHRDCGWYRTKILILDEKWRIARIFQKFLYQISPLWWRKEFDFIHGCKGSHELPSDTSLLGKHQGGSLTSVPSIITIIDQFIEDIGKAEPPMLYFTKPDELHQIFFELERNNLLALLQCEELTQPAQQMVSGLERARQLFKHEVDILREHLNSLEDEVIFEETRSKECEGKAKAISFGLFRDLIVDRHTLNLYVNVEDCFEVCVAPNDSNLTLSMMMKSIEYEQESLLIALDNLPKKIMRKALKVCYQEDAEMMRQAQEAQKMMTQIENLMRTLRKSFEPRAEPKRGRKLLWRSEPPVGKTEVKEQGKSWTKEQQEYLYFFTDFCSATDDPEVGRQLWNQKTVKINM